MLVNDMLPEVSTLLVPKRLYLYPQILFAEGLFDGLYQTDEDKKRSEMYHAEKKRKEDVKKFQNIEEFLKSLELKVFIREAAKEEIPRIAQLTQKTNQFNLTTRRYSEVQVESFFPDKMKKIYTLKVTDRFGDFGLTGVMIVFKEDSSAKIDTLLLSCRILGRSIEKVFVDFCLKDIISKWNPDLIAAEYLPTKKNVQTLTFWESLGFMLIEEREGIKSYRLNANEYIQSDISYIKINPS
jgi:FkbH-like protein